MVDSKLAYPLEQVITVKENRVKEAERVVAEKRQALEKEQEKLRQAEEQRDKAKKHYADKLAQLREKLDTGTNSTEAQQMKVYLKVTQEKMVAEEKKVKDQQVQVEQAEKNLEVAKEQLRLKRQEVDKLLNHKADWTKQMLFELGRIEAAEQDEMGSIIFSGKRLRK